MHQLGDELLPWHDPILAGLRPHGLNPEGKTRKGVPDSFVGDTQKTCRAAVEYTTKETRLEVKFSEDYSGVRSACPHATHVVLCTNRSIDGLNLSGLQNEAESDGVTLRIIAGHDLARFLCQRQDLRHRYLGIPIGAHTATSLIETAWERLSALTVGKLPPNTLDRLIARPRTDRLLVERLQKAPADMTLIVAPAGMGKSTWSIANAMRHAGGQPVFWTAAVDLSLADGDPLGIVMVQAAYGAPDPARINELADLLSRERFIARMYVDAIDETQNYQQIARAVRNFRACALGPHTHLILLCREEAITAFDLTLGQSFPDLFKCHSDARISIDSLSEAESCALLEKHGATRAEIRAIKGLLPAAYRENPLFLLRSLAASRRGGLPIGPGADVASVLVDHFVHDIAHRLMRDGAGPSEVMVSLFLQKLALRTLSNARNALSIDDVATLPGGDVEGENTIVGRAVQAGLLLRLGDGTDLGFSHALFLEYFAARGIERETAANWARHLPSLATPLGRRVAARLAASLSDPNPLVRALMDQDEICACEAAANTRKPLDPMILENLIHVMKRLLASRFPSDRTRALRLLAGIKCPKTVDAAVEWWNTLPIEQRPAWIDEASDLFLKLQVAGAAGIILGHHELRQPLGMPWYEPLFVRSLQALSSACRTALCGAARRQLLEAKASGQAHTPQTMLLAIMGEDWLVDYFHEQHMQGQMLETEAHRALIFLNTPRSIELFGDSVDRHLNLLDRMRSNPDEGSNTHPEIIWERIVLRCEDVSMYAHEHLLGLIEMALNSTRWDHVSFGFRWADLLKSTQLLPSYSAARARYHGGAIAPTGRMIEGLLGILPFDQVRALYDTNNENVRKDIVESLHRVPGHATEEFLVRLLDETIYRFAAIQSLGLLRAVRAGPAIHRWLRDGGPQFHEIALTALGLLRHRPALGDLVHLLERLVGQRRVTGVSEAEKLEYSEYSLIGAIGRIGGPEAFAALAKVFPDTEFPNQVLQSLIHSGAEEGIAQARIVVQTYENARASLVNAIVRHNFHEGPRNLYELPRPWLKDEVLLEHVLKYADRAVASGRLDPLLNEIVATAAFDLDPARRFLVRVAAREPEPESQVGLIHDGRDPVREARRVLGRLGHDRYMHEALMDTLDRIESRDLVYDSDARHLGRWPTELVREALIQRIEVDGAKAGMMLYLFQWFARAEDRQLFERLECGDNPTLADLAHQYLVDPMQW